MSLSGFWRYGRRVCFMATVSRIASFPTPKPLEAEEDNGTGFSRFRIGVYIYVPSRSRTLSGFGTGQPVRQPAVRF